jgi:hypothetical protein
MVEIVRTYYDVARVSANINPVCLRENMGWASSMDVPGKGVGPIEKHYYI